MVKILCADNNRVASDLYTSLFYSFCEPELYCPSDGLDALNCIRECEKDYDLIIADELLPRIDGLDFLKAINGKTTSVRILTCTTASQDIYSQVVSSGALGLIEKPFDLNIIKDILKDILNGKTEAFEKYQRSILLT